MNFRYHAMRSLRALIVSTAFFTLAAPLAHAQTPLPQKILVPTDVDDTTYLPDWGRSVSLLGSRALVGASYLSGLTGVYVFEQSGGKWIQKQHLLTPNLDVERGKGMGDLTEQDDTSILTTDSEYGAAYYFQKNSTGNFRATAILTGGHPISGFATSIGMSGCFIAIGSDNGSIESGAPREGAVHMYDKCGSNPVWVGSLYAPNAFAGNQFSKGLALLGYEMMIGAPGVDGGAGAVFYYTYNGTKWILKQKIVQAHAAPGNHFGSVVSFRNGLAAIGAPDQPDVGQVEIFKKGSNGAWSSQGLLTAPSSDGTWKGFGRKLTVTPDYVVIAASATYPDVLGAKAFVYRRTADTLSLQNTLEFPTQSTVSSSDISLSVSGQGLIVGNPSGGAPLNGDARQVGGVTWVFQLPR